MKYLATMFAVVLFAQCGKDDPTPIGDVNCSTVTYSGVIKPLVATKCTLTDCHNAGSVNGDFTTYATFAPFATSGKVRQQVLVTMAMPKTGSLTSDQLGQIECWLDDGAPDN